MDLLFLLLVLLEEEICFCHPNTFDDRRSGDVVTVGPGDDCNKCRLLLDKCCCCNCRDDGFCHPNTFSLRSKLFLALTPPNNKSTRGRNRVLRASTAVRSPCRRRDCRSNINALIILSSESLLLIARAVLLLTALILRCYSVRCLCIFRFCLFLSSNFGFRFN